MIAPSPAVDAPGPGCPGCAAAGAQLAAAEEARRKAVAAVAELEAHLADAIDLCVALERLHGTTDHGEVLRAIQDVVINLIGSEELAVFQPGPGGALRAVQSFGVARGRLAQALAGDGPVARAAAERRSGVRGGLEPARGGDPDLTAAVPLLAEGQLMGVLVIWRMLPQKPELRPADRRVLELLGAHGGRALYLTARAGGPPPA